MTIKETRDRLATIAQELQSIAKDLGERPGDFIPTKQLRYDLRYAASITAKVSTQLGVRAKVEEEGHA